MSLAPAAYLLFQKRMRHDPADPAWSGPRPLRALVRALLDHALHPALPRRLRPRARRPEGAAHLGQQDPRPPRARPHRRRRDHHRPTRPGRRQRRRHGDGRAPRARPVRPGRPPEGESPFDHHVYAICSDGDLEEGVSARGLEHRRAPAARQPDPDLRRQPDQHRGRHAHRVHRGRREALRGLRLARPDRRLDQRRRPHRRQELPRGRPGALGRRSRRGRGGARPAQPDRAAHDHRLAGPERAEHRPGARLRARRGRGRRHQEGARLRPERDLRGLRRGDQPHPRAASTAARSPRPSGTSSSPPGQPAHAERAALLRPDGDRGPARPAGPTRLPTFPADEKGMATRKASGYVLTAIAPVLPELWGGSADLAESNNTSPQGEPSFTPEEWQTREWSGNTYGRVLHFGIREHAMGAIMNGIALHGGTRVYGGTFLVFSDYMRPAVRLAALMQLPTRTCGPTTRSASARTDRPTSRSSTWPRSARSRASTWSARPTPTRPSPPGARCSSTPTDRQALALTPAERAGLPPRRAGLQRRPTGSRRAATSCSTPTASPTWCCRHRLGGAARGRRARAAGREGHRRPRGLDAVPGVVRRQDQAYRDTVIPPTSGPGSASRPASPRAGARSSATTAGSSRSEHFGASADYATIFREFGITAEAVALAAEESLRALEATNR